MPPRTPPRYIYSRLFVYGLVALILGWIMVSVALSVGVAVFWEYERGASLPKENYVLIETPAQALTAARGLTIFNRELLANVRRFLAHYRQEPEQTVEVWNTWRQEWRQDLSTFGRKHSFTRKESELSTHERSLNEVYGGLLKLEAGYAESFEEISHIHSRNQDALSRNLQTLEAELARQVGP